MRARRCSRAEAVQLVAAAGLIATSARSLPRIALFQPRSIVAAVAALASGEAPTLLAGGTDLVAQFNLGVQPSALIDLSQVAELRAIDATAQGLRIGACVTHGQGAVHAAVVERAPGFAAAWARIANPRIRMRATLGGNVMALRTRYEVSLLLTALNARLEFATQAGALQLSPSELWAGQAPPRSVLTAVHLETASLASFTYERTLRPLMTLAVALRRTDDGLHLSCAIASEFLPPLAMTQALPGLQPQALARNAQAIARDVFAQLPTTFADPVLSNAYARRAGAVLLERRLGRASHG